MSKRTSLVLLGLAAIGAVAYRFRRQIVGWPLKLSPALYDVGLTRDLAVPVADGIRIMADHYYPKAPGAFPTILIRSPYGKGMEAGVVGLAYRFLAERFAERGYHVIAQGTRGRYNSDGEFNPFFNEAADGQATLDWITRQAWCNGSIGMWGVSYMGYTQWAAATHPQVTPQLAALMPILTTSQFSSVLFADGAFSLDAVLHWTQIIFTNGYKHRPITVLLPAEEDRRLAPHWNTLPLIELDREVFGESIPFYREGFDYPDPGDPHWTPIDHSGEVGHVTAATHFISGWYDFMLRESLADYARMLAAGRAPHLTIGPWYHADVNWIPEAIRLGLNWFDIQLKGERELLRAKPVRIYVMGADEWRDLEAWPPPAQAARFYLAANRQLHVGSAPERLPGEVSTDRYRYDPADPTPSLGGPLINLPNGAALDNRGLEARADVLTYTTPPLEHDVEVIGPVCLELYARSSLPHTDFFGRVCDVQPDGRSLNICDGLIRVKPGVGEKQPDGSLRLEIDLWATAHRFLHGHCLRLQISSGAHPRWARNLGTGEPIGTGTAMLAADQTIYHDREHPSALVLPILDSAGHKME